MSKVEQIIAMGYQDKVKQLLIDMLEKDKERRIENEKHRELRKKFDTRVKQAITDFTETDITEKHEGRPIIEDDVFLEVICRSFFNAINGTICYVVRSAINGGVKDEDREKYVYGIITNKITKMFEYHMRDLIEDIFLIKMGKDGIEEEVHEEAQEEEKVAE